MQEINIEEIEEKAVKFAKEGKSWHFHILTPECAFNQKISYAFVLENTTDNEVFIHYSDHPAMEVGEKLVKLLHGDDVVKDDKKDTGNEPEKELPNKIKELLENAKKMTKEGKFWHHHMFLPDCVFNDSEGKWVIVYEGQDTGDVHKIATEEEPKAALREIESLFYEQKKDN